MQRGEEGGLRSKGQNPPTRMGGVSIKCPAKKFSPSSVDNLRLDGSAVGQLAQQ